MYISSEDNDSSHEGSGETQYDESDDDKEGNEAYGRRHDIDVLKEPATYQNYIYDEALQIAPGEGNKPFGLLSTMNCDPPHRIPIGSLLHPRRGGWAKCKHF